MMKLLLALLLTYVALTAAHVNHGPESDELRAFKRHMNSNARRSLAECSDKLRRNGIYARAEMRRRATVEENKYLHVRDTTSVLDTSHHSHQDVKSSTPDKKLFKSEKNCVLNPEGETGPYYVPGEYIRSNLREKQPGVPLVLEAQFIDVETCKPIQNIWWDLWNCNSTGVYSGVVEMGNGNTNDAANINATFLRGIQKADHDGVVTFKTIFPGHYSGRTTHHHMVAHLDATRLSNGTLTGGTVAHVGQAFWDQSLIYKVEATHPYSTNTIAITKNADDRVFLDETEDTTSDPVFEYVYLGKKLEHGIFGWITVAVNSSASYDPNYSFIYTTSGGVEESGGSISVHGGSGGVPSGAAPPSGVAPSGAAPSGTASSTTSSSSVALARRSFDNDWH